MNQRRRTFLDTKVNGEVRQSSNTSDLVTLG
jgi:2-keto-4-pentenoate hydratase/2-oxohepta-3-ene-1,7-dioic acid hydratase in catechol pathway